MKRSPDNDLLAPAAAVVAVAICCGAPLAIAFLLTTGLGAALVANGWLLGGLALLGVGLILGVRYLARANARTDPRHEAVEDCCAPTTSERAKGTTA